MNHKARITLVDVDRETLSANQTAGENPTTFPDDSIGPGKRVKLHFALRLSDGELIDSNFDRAPVVFTVGDGNLLPGFEQALFGLKAGDQRDVELAPEQAFGPVVEDNIQRFPRYRFPPDLELTKGLVIDFADAAGNTQAGVIIDWDASLVSVDFNHPLAGRQIHFNVHVHHVEKSETP